ncbi:MAG: cell division protein FtsQ/DivIB [Pseudomonadota bacterium]
MAKQARRRREPKMAPRPVLKLPAAAIRRATVLTATMLVVVAALTGARMVLDVPIASLAIDGPFQRVTAMQVRGAIGDELDAGFISVRLARLRERIEALAWVDQASVRRQWPDQIHVVVAEQVPAAQWGERGLLNVRGELFTQEARHELAELPRLTGPESEVTRVASQYLSLRGPLIEAGLGLRAVTLDERGAWQFVLGNGIEVRLGRQDTEVRADRFVAVAAPVVARHQSKIRYVDMRYSNGFSIGWKRPEFREQVRLEAAAAASVSQGVQ